MVIFHGHVSHNQMVIHPKSDSGRFGIYASKLGFDSFATTEHEAHLGKKIYPVTLELPSKYWLVFESIPPGKLT